MAAEFLYLSTVGRVTGQERQIEIWFVEQNGHYYVVAEAREQAGWVRNLLKEPNVTFSVGSRGARASVVPQTAGRARIVRDEAEPALAAEVKGLMDAKYGWSDGLLIELSSAR
jgi:deazaflavin-dependent oxidoreductase (nitroreductase family)